MLSNLRTQWRSDCISANVRFPLPLRGPQDIAKRHESLTDQPQTVTSISDVYLDEIA
jgi:hypothetical protein